MCLHQAGREAIVTGANIVVARQRVIWTPVACTVCWAELSRCYLEAGIWRNWQERARGREAEILRLRATLAGSPALQSRQNSVPSILYTGLLGALQAKMLRQLRGQGATVIQITGAPAAVVVVDIMALAGPAARNP